MKQRSLEEQLFVAGLFLPLILLAFYGAGLLTRAFLPAPLQDCVWNRFFHIYCPGCGATRAAVCFFQGHWIRALWYHPAVVYGLILYFAFMGSQGLALLSRHRVRGLAFREWYLYAALVILFANFVLKNLLRQVWGITLEQFWGSP